MFWIKHVICTMKEWPTTTNRTKHTYTKWISELACRIGLFFFLLLREISKALVSHFTTKPNAIFSNMKFSYLSFNAVKWIKLKRPGGMNA